MGGVGDDDRLYFRQMLSGRDFAAGDQLATQMVNFCYLIGDRTTGEALVVDPAYGVSDLIDAAGRDGMRIVGVLATHHHPDHVGGSMMGYRIEGLAELLTHHSVPVHAHRDEAGLITRTTGLEAGDVIGHDGGDRVEVGGLTVELLHTPGHTPGHICSDLDTHLCTASCNTCANFVVPASTPFAIAPDLEISYRLRSHVGSTGSFTSGLAPIPWTTHRTSERVASRTWSTVLGFRVAVQGFAHLLPRAHHSTYVRMLSTIWSLLPVPAGGAGVACRRCGTRR